MDKTTVELSPYDVGMICGVLSLARRYGDTQIFDWAGDFRTRLIGNSPYQAVPLKEFQEEKEKDESDQ